MATAGGRVVGRYMCMTGGRVRRRDRHEGGQLGKLGRREGIWRWVGQW